MNLPILEIFMSDKKSYQILINIFQKYSDNKYKYKSFWKSIKIDFENWIKKY